MNWKEKEEIKEDWTEIENQNGTTKENQTLYMRVFENRQGALRGSKDTYDTRGGLGGKNGPFEGVTGGRGKEASEGTLNNLGGPEVYQQGE